jgi:hypothetical protein
MYKLRTLDDSANEFYCLFWMQRRHGRMRFLVPLCLVASAAVSAQCKGDPPAEKTSGSNLQLEILSIEASAGARGERPFIAGEKARITAKLQGGAPPYDLQVATAIGSPTLANASTRVEIPERRDDEGEAMEVGMDLPLASEVPSGRYGLLLRVTDNEGIGASVRSEPFELIGSNAALAPPIESTTQLQVVDVAGRARARFYQGEEIHIRALVVPGETVAVTILASDDRPFMPMRSYQSQEARVDLPLRIPRLARVGSYRVVLATKSSEAAVPLEVIGEVFAPARTPVLEELQLLGGKDFRVARKGALRLGEPLRVEARAGGVHARARARLRLRTRAGQVVAQAELGEIVPSDPHPAARSMLSATWTPDASLIRGRHVLELEITEGEELATLYREIVLR